MADSIHVTLSMNDTIQTIDNAIIGGSVTGERIDAYTLPAPGGTACVVLVYEKHYYRAGNRLTLTVTVDDFEGRTRVTCVSGGGGEGLFRFDWGASDSFAGTVMDALQPYAV